MATIQPDIRRFTLHDLAPQHRDHPEPGHRLRMCLQLAFVLAVCLLTFVLGAATAQP